MQQAIGDDTRDSGRAPHMPGRLAATFVVALLAFAAVAVLAFATGAMVGGVMFSGLRR